MVPQHQRIAHVRLVADLQPRTHGSLPNRRVTPVTYGSNTDTLPPAATRSAACGDRIQDELCTPQLFALHR